LLLKSSVESCLVLPETDLICSHGLRNAKHD
jgi:hypothetical protein